MNEVRVRPFESGDELAFRELNEAWIAKYFTIEDAERDLLEDPVGNILQIGGYIFMAVADTLPVGCCALIPMQPGEFELAKMAVEERLRGRGIGRKVLEYAIAHARKIGATRLYLETNRKLENAIHLYESVGFRHVSPDQVIPSPYTRANVFMEMSL
ncbi:MAG TPA: GNAT family N-acetyltransferase [Terriglobales bacterium]|nr:GNAT family N-acetyltransferase [Terriglobales bacterium]